MAVVFPVPAGADATAMRAADVAKWVTMAAWPALSFLPSWAGSVL
ncbi:Uncharacterised protein [Nocardia africana]|uniref:Uncharacterized protein n=1 Tax=Nocardia africana TaxID=134964 RepID=A0A378X139_9NOCA|nr:Uncharacterised protein [Nocardia africana]